MILIKQGQKKNNYKMKLINIKLNQKEQKN